MYPYQNNEIITKLVSVEQIDLISPHTKTIRKVYGTTSVEKDDTQNYNKVTTVTRVLLKKKSIFHDKTWGYFFQIGLINFAGI